MPTNIRSFKPRKREPEWAGRGLAAMVYLGLALCMPELGFMLLLGMAIFYWVFIHRGVLKPSYFFRFHFLQATLLFLALAVAYAFLVAGLKFLAATLNLVGASDLLVYMNTAFPLYARRLVTYGCLLAGASQALVALLGKTPRIPYITANILYWI